MSKISPQFTAQNCDELSVESGQSTAHRVPREVKAMAPEFRRYGAERRLRRSPPGGQSVGTSLLDP